MSDHGLCHTITAVAGRVAEHWGMSWIMGTIPHAGECGLHQRVLRNPKSLHDIQTQHTNSTGGGNVVHRLKDWEYGQLHPGRAIQIGRTGRRHL